MTGTQKLLVFFVFCFVGCTILSAIMDGGSGFASTYLETAVDVDDTTLEVDNVRNFLNSGSVYIDHERIYYSSKTDNIVGADTFNNCERGFEGTEAQSHAASIASSPTQVYNKSASVLDQVVEFNVAEAMSTVGPFKTAWNTSWALTKSIPKFIAWDYSFFTGDLVILQFFMFALSCGMVITLFSMAIGVVQRLFV